MTDNTYEATVEDFETFLKENVDELTCDNNFEGEPINDLQEDFDRLDIDPMSEKGLLYTFAYFTAGNSSESAEGLIGETEIDSFEDLDDLNYEKLGKHSQYNEIRRTNHEKADEAVKSLQDISFYTPDDLDPGSSFKNFFSGLESSTKKGEEYFNSASNSDSKEQLRRIDHFYQGFKAMESLDSVGDMGAFQVLDYMIRANGQGELDFLVPDNLKHNYLPDRPGEAFNKIWSNYDRSVNEHKDDLLEDLTETVEEIEGFEEEYAPLHLETALYEFSDRIDA